MTDTPDHEEWQRRKEKADKEYEIRKQKLAESFRVAPEAVVEGLVVLGGVVGLGDIRDNEICTLDLSLKPWRYQGDADFKDTKLVLTTEIAPDDVDQYRELLTENKAYQLKAKVADYRFTTVDKAILLEVVGETTDPVFIELAAEVSREVTFDDPILGHFVLDKRLRCFKGQAQYQGESVVIRIDADQEGNIYPDYLANMKQFWPDFDSWVEKAKQLTAEENIDDVWPDENPDREEITTEEAYMDAMRLVTVSACDDDHMIALGFDDDERLVGGHEIVVDINLSTGELYTWIA
uniref:DUF2262 domain-containing protein n=1 Tax=Thaumasiovibrio occultus TaxID=1891184 RepID=UPI000B363E35|nr:DUF2262 domain-containing protein [Thaumasiovibrio occultus]